MDKLEKAELLFAEAEALISIAEAVEAGVWQNGRLEAAAVAERLLYYVQETDLEDTNCENIIRKVQSPSGKV